MGRGSPTKRTPGVRIGRAITDVPTVLARRAPGPVLIVHGEENGFPARVKAGTAEAGTR